MEPLVYSVVLANEDARTLCLAPGDIGRISPAMWEQLAGEMSGERKLVGYPASVLARRCREGYAGAAIAGGSIISYIAVVPIALPAAAAPSCAALTADLDRARPPLAATRVYLITGGWTGPAWRGQGINASLELTLVRRYLGAGSLGISGIAGQSTPVLANLGWQIMGWDRVPFVSSLVGIPAREFPEQAAHAWCSPPGLRPYQGPHLGLDAAGHPWAQYLYFWASDAMLAESLDGQLCAAFDGDLHRWRSAIVAGFSGPDTLWKAAFLSC